MRARFTLWFAGAALVPIVAAAIVAWLQISRGYEEEFERTLAGAHAAARRELEAVRAAAVRGAAAARDSPFLHSLVIELAKGAELSPTQQRELRGNAEAFQKSMGLEVLTVVDAEGTVLVSPHFSAKIYDHDPEPERVRAAGAPVVAWTKVLRQGTVAPVLVVEAASTLAERGQVVTVLAGRELSRELLDPLQRDGISARLVDTRGGTVLSTGSTPKGAPAVDLELDGIDGKPLAHLVVAVSDAGLRQRLREVALYSAALAAAAIIGAILLALFVSRRMSRDLDALLGGVRAVASGDLDHRVEARGRDEIGKVAGAFNVMTHDLKEAKEKLVMAERVAAWQDIAKSLAHELKNPLTPIQMSVETMRKTWEKKHASFDEIFDESTRTVLEEVQRLKKIITEFSQFARMPTQERRACDVNEVTASAITLYRGAVRVVSELGGGLPAIDADRDQLTQVILNLLENARDAVASRGSDESVGRITVRTRSVDARVVLEVEDNGPGFDPALKDRLFAPYFTTKESGTGLGLAIVRRIVSDHGGRIEATSAPGAGARFTIELPAVPS
jgi:signal transduction histidine kinase